MGPLEGRSNRGEQLEWGPYLHLPPSSPRHPRHSPGFVPAPPSLAGKKRGGWGGGEEKGEEGGMGKRGLPPSQLWLPWQPTAAAAAGSSEGGRQAVREGGGKLGTGGREGMERRRRPPLGATGGSRGTTLGPHPRTRHPLELPIPALGQRTEGKGQRKEQCRSRDIRGVTDSGEVR